jgi:hypothetical protein
VLWACARTAWSRHERGGHDTHGSDVYGGDREHKRRDATDTRALRADEASTVTLGLLRTSPNAVETKQTKQRSPSGKMMTQSGRPRRTLESVRLEQNCKKGSSRNMVRRAETNARSERSRQRGEFHLEVLRPWRKIWGNPRRERGAERIRMGKEVRGTLKKALEGATWLYEGQVPRLTPLA